MKYDVRIYGSSDFRPPTSDFGFRRGGKFA